MIFNIRKPEYTTNPGCLNSNLAITNNQTEAQRNAYCTIIKQEFPPVKTLAPWIRLTRYGIYSVLPASKPDWSTVTTQYWTNMYYRATGSDIMSTRKIMFEPILNIRQNTGTGFMVRTCASPNYFGRNSSGVHVVADGSNTWRSDIRLQLGTFCGTDIGSTGGSGNLAQVLTTNFNVGLILGPNEIDPWGNARLYYVDDAECTGGAAPTEATRAGVSALAGSGGLQILFLRIYDHQRHIFDWCRANRPDIGAVAPSIIEMDNTPGSREFCIYDWLTAAHAGAGLVQGYINDVCDAHQIHPHMRQGILVDPWSATAAATQMSGLISEWHYWTAQAQVQTWRAANGYANNIRPLLATETGQAYSGNGANLGSRTDIHQLRSLKYGQLAIGPLFYGACLNSFYSVGLSPAVDAQGVAGAFNLLLNDSSAWFTDTASKKDADYVAVSFDFSETSDQIPFVSKAWKDYWNHKTWLVWMANQQQTPLGTDINTCPFPEWNRVTFTSNQVAMAAGGRNVIAHAKQLRRGVHTFKAEVKLDNAGSQAALYVTGYDKLNGLASVKSNTLVGVQDWTLLSCSFSPRQHGNPRVPDPAIAVLRVEHNGTGTCYVRNPVVEMPGSITAPGNYFDIAVTDITWAPASVTAAMSVTFSATITNVGNSPSPAAAHEVSLFIDNVLFGTGTVSTSIAAQTARSQTISGTWTATGGTHALRAVSTFMTNEFSPDNNSFTKSIVVASDLYFDLTVSDITWIPASPKAGDLVSFTAAVQNIGTDVSPSGVPTGVKFSVDGVMASFSDNITTGIAAGVTRQQTANGPAASGGMWTATEGTHSVVAWVDDVNRFPTERDKTNNTRTESIVVTAAVTPPQGISPPQQAVNAGLNLLAFNDEFDQPTISMYHPTNTGTVSGAPISYSPTGKWKHSDWWGDPESPGYKDFGPNSSYDVNPLIPNPALASLQPISKLSASVMRITLRRLNLPSNPPYRALINNQWKGQDPGNYIADGLQWSGCWIGTGIGINDGRDFIRPLYVEAYLRIPNATLGNGAGFWMYESGRSTNTHSGAAVKPEVDIFDISGDPNTWYSHLHGTGHEAEFVASPSEPYSGWHKYGFLWQTNSLSIYRDDVLRKTWTTSPDVTWFSDYMNVIISFAGDDYYPIPTNITELYFDFDWVRVWKTGAPSQVVLPTGINSAFNGYLPLPASSPWNTDITNYPVDTNSTAILTKSDLSTNLRCEALAGPYNGISGMQYITVPANQPLKTVVFDGYRTDTVSWPIPDNAPVEGYEDTGYQDRHVMVLQLDPTKPNGMGKLYELFAARPQGSYPTGTTSWLASFGIIWDMNANEVLAAQQTSADAAGLPILPGVLRYDEVASGEIKHALRFTLAPGYTRKSYVLPASHHAGFGTTSEYAPFGMRVRLKASVPETGYPAEVQTIMRCLKKYGMFMADNGGNWFISGTMDSRWNVDNLVWLGYLHPSDFEVLQMGTIFSY